MQISDMIQEVNGNQQKSEYSEHQESWGILGCSETPTGVLGAGAP